MMWAGFVTALFISFIGILIASCASRRKAYFEKSDTRPPNVPKKYGWADFIWDVDNGVPNDVIFEKVKWCGMPKRPQKKEEVVFPDPVSLQRYPFGGSCFPNGSGVSNIVPYQVTIYPTGTVPGNSLDLNTDYTTSATTM